MNSCYVKSRRLICLLPLILAFSATLAQSKSNRTISTSLRKSKQSLSAPLPNQHIWATSFQLYDLNFQALNLELNGSDIAHRDTPNVSGTVTIALPNPKGGFDVFRVLKNSTMHPDLCNKFPEIRTYDVIGLSDRSKKGKIDITPQGFHAMVFDKNNGTYFIDPVELNRTDLYMVYAKSDFVTNKLKACSHEHQDEQEMIKEIVENEDDIRISYASCVLRTYRLAVAGTGEYTTFHGGTVALAQAAQVTTMNRVNGVYEREIAITMQIIANNDLLVYTNSSTDPYTNGTPNTMITQNQNNVTSVIGAANYDIGHVFGTNSGGLAGLGVVCSNSNKARGVTGSSAPVGDPFDIDYVAHEMGHQFGANHTQNNSCNSVANSRYEPGSASTIMGYAGICAPNVQSNSDDYFHSRSLQEIGTYISGSSHQCPVITTIANQAPSIASTNAGVSVPISTPFALTAVASDPNASNSLVYRWEQYNNQASTQPPVATATGGPNFRSFVSSPSPTRYFPNLTALASNGPFTWEVVPSITRTMNFRVTVHDDHEIGGCSDYVAATLNFDASAGPFVLTYPSTVGINWPAGSLQTVTWNVANTNNAAVNCQLVRLFLSTDGGTSYPILLAEDVPNTGSFEVTTPNLPNTTSRIMVMADNGTFFDISDNNFTISSADGYDAELAAASIEVCPGTEAVYSIDVSEVGNFSGDVSFSVSGLPGSAAIQWSDNPVSVPGQTTFTINTSSLNPGTYQFSIHAMSTSGPQVLFCTLIVTSAPTNTAFNLVGQQLIAEQSFGQHQWFDCKDTPPSPILGATGPTLNLTNATGSYALQVTNGDCISMSDCLEIDMTNVDTYTSANISVFPNPAQQQVTISWSETINIQTLKLYDAAGKLIDEVQSSEDHYIFDLTQVSRGIYFIELIGAEHNLRTKVVKN